MSIRGYGTYGMDHPEGSESGGNPIIPALFLE
jgi:hypothetical protein